MNNANKPANSAVLIGHNNTRVYYGGLTKREHIATEIMAGFASDPTMDGPKTCAEIAVEWAEALLAELEKREKTNETD